MIGRGRGNKAPLPCTIESRRADRDCVLNPPDYAARCSRSSIFWRNSPKSIGLVSNPAAPSAYAMQTDSMRSILQDQINAVREGAN